MAGARAARGATSASPGRTHERIYAAVRRIPVGRVATYGQIAILAGFPRQPRLVGYALHALPRGTTVPWHRVINAQGRISARAGEPAGSLTQRMLLEAEGIAFDARGRTSLERYGWRPRRTAPVTPRAASRASSG
jgi:methylated-DNA-protein-cysteine methyltransferase-like protein